MIKIAVDGPSGAGKSSLARAVAHKMNIVYVDTGALYRTVGLYMQKNGISPDDSASVIAALPSVVADMRFIDGEQHVFLCGEDVGDKIRTPEISMYASKVSAIPEVRAFLLDMQRSIANTNDIIMDGRDIGTVIFPDADVKIFLTASNEARARRRYAELAAKGISTTYEEVLADMIQRDTNDSTRAVAPAIAAPDATVLDNSELSAEETVSEALKIIENGLKKNSPDDQVKKNTDEGAKSPVSNIEKSKFYLGFHTVFAKFFRFILRLKPQGQENFPLDGGCIVCANHVSLLDVFAISACLPKSRRLRYLAKAELFRIPILRSVIVALGACRLERKGGDIAAMKKAISLVKNGEAIAIFPQGTRCKGKNPRDTEVKSGAGMIAYHSKSPVIPICIKTKKQKYALFRRVDIIIGKPIEYSELGFSGGGSKEYKAAIERIFSEICALGDFEQSVAKNEEQ